MYFEGELLRMISVSKRDEISGNGEHRLTLTPNDPYRVRTAPLNSKRFILYIYSINIGTEYFKHGIYSPLFSLQNAVYFIILTYLVSCIIHILYTGCAKIKTNNFGAKRLVSWFLFFRKILLSLSNQVG